MPSSLNRFTCTVRPNVPGVACAPQGYARLPSSPPSSTGSTSTTNLMDLASNAPAQEEFNGSDLMAFTPKAGSESAADVGSSERNRGAYFRSRLYASQDRIGSGSLRSATASAAQSGDESDLIDMASEKARTESSFTGSDLLAMRRSREPEGRSAASNFHDALVASSAPGNAHPVSPLLSLRWAVHPDRVSPSERLARHQALFKEVERILGNDSGGASSRQTEADMPAPFPETMSHLHHLAAPASLDAAIQGADWLPLASASSVASGGQRAAGPDLPARYA